MLKNSKTRFFDCFLANRYTTVQNGRNHSRKSVLLNTINSLLSFYSESGISCRLFTEITVQIDPELIIRKLRGQVLAQQSDQTVRLLCPEIVYNIK